MGKISEEHTQFLMAIPAVAALFDGADVVDLKTIEAPVSLREYIAEFAGYRPAVLDGLYAVRQVFARLLGLAHEAPPAAQRLHPEEVSMQPGEELLFTVIASEEDRYWIAGEKDSHLDFEVAIVIEPLAAGMNRLYTITFVRYNKPVGRFYFGVIAPFHHLLVNMFMRTAVRNALKRYHSPAA